ncbi:eukaryotic translation initiation factor 1b isoform X1 [Pyxicephalus adspersus]|uniref:eukaryotic translation initiation factor 1b isoform X1 n=1 Tax=Pyxicephalus adspersus TaxID=30357 RepID=UPI003B5C8897
MSSIQNLNSFDPFADATKGDDLLPAGTEDYIHIRIQQRNGRKTLTTVQGIADDYDKKKLVKAFKKKFACNGTVIEHPEYGEVIQLQGDQRKNICQFLMEAPSQLLLTPEILVRISCLEDLPVMQIKKLVATDVN